jgi:hypothetical protein
LKHEERRTKPRKRRRRRREKWGNNEYYIYCSVLVDGEEINMMDLQVPRHCLSVRILLRW